MTSTSRPAADTLAPASPSKPTFVLAVTGSIAAYKSVEIARALIKAGARVLPVMTPAATKLLAPLTLSGITGEPVVTNMWDPSFAGEVHIALAARADAIVIAPATADTLSRLASGRANDIVTALALCAACPVLLAPAMHPRMWSHPSVTRNVSTLRADGRVELIGPEDGEVASGDSGVGRMTAPETIAAIALSRILKPDLKGLRIVVTAGPTVEDLDPVRFIGNRSTGKMGFAIAERAAARGATVTLIAGPVALPTPPNVNRHDVRSALAMQTALAQTLGADLSFADILIMTAAVADYRPAERSTTKLKRSASAMTLDLVPNPDLLAEIGLRREQLAADSPAPAEANAPPLPVLVGFAVETDTDERVVEKARGKLHKKRVDMVVANHAEDSFGRDDNRATLVTRTAAVPFGVLSKKTLADKILDCAAAFHLR